MSPVVYKCAPLSQAIRMPHTAVDAYWNLEMPGWVVEINAIHHDDDGKSLCNEYTPVEIPFIVFRLFSTSTSAIRKQARLIQGLDLTQFMLCHKLLIVRCPHILSPTSLGEIFRTVFIINECISGPTPADVDLMTIPPFASPMPGIRGRGR